MVINFLLRAFDGILSEVGFAEYTSKCLIYKDVQA